MNATMTEPVKITDTPGAAIDLNATRFPERLATGSHELWLKLGAATGRLTPGGVSGFVESGTPESGWRTPRDLSAEHLRAIIEQVVFAQGRSAKRFTLDAPADLPIHDQLDVHYARAQRRRLREG